MTSYSGPALRYGQVTLLLSNYRPHPQGEIKRNGDKILAGFDILDASSLIVLISRPGDSVCVHSVQQKPLKTLSAIAVPLLLPT